MSIDIFEVVAKGAYPEVVTAVSLAVDLNDHDMFGKTPPNERERKGFE